MQKKVVLELEEKNPDFKESVMIAISGCGNGCSHPQISDIGFVGTKVRDEEGNRVEGYDVLLGGQLHGASGSRIARKSGVKVEASKLVCFVGDLIASYKTDNLGQDSFRNYLNIVELAK